MPTEEGFLITIAGDDSGLDKAFESASKALGKIEDVADNASKSLQGLSSVSSKVSNAAASIAKSSEVAESSLTSLSNISGQVGSKIGEALSGSGNIGQSITTSVEPAIQILERLQAEMIELKAAIASSTNTDEISRLNKALGELEGQARSITITGDYTELNKASDGAANSLARIDEATKRANTSLSNHASVAKNAGNSAGIIAKSADEAQVSLTKLSNVSQQAGERIQTALTGSTNIGENITKSVTPAIAILDRLEVEMAELRAAIASSTSTEELERLKIALSDLEGQARTIKISADYKELNAASKGAVNSLGKIDKALESTNRNLAKHSVVSKAASGAAAQLAKSSAVTGGSLDKVAKGSGAATQSLINTSRVLQDLPYGFLGIANNLDPLLESFQRLRKESKETGVSLGSSLKSALMGPAGLGIALSALSFIVIKFGDDIAAAFNKANVGAERMNSIFAGGMEGFAKAGSLVKELGINIDLAKQGLLKKEDVLRQYNETIGKTTGEVKNLDEAEKALVKNGDAYVRMMFFKAAANISLQKAAEKAFEAEQARLKADKEFVNFGTQAKVGLLDQFFLSEEFNPGEYEKGLKKAGEQRKKAAIETAENESRTFEGIAQKFQKDAAEIAKRYKFDFFDEITKSGSKKMVEKSKVNFYDTFFDFDYNSKNLKEEQRASLVKAAAEFQSDFRKIYEGLDFVLQDKNGLKAAIDFWENYKKGIVKFKPDAFLSDAIELTPPEIVVNEPNMDALKQAIEDANIPTGPLLTKVQIDTALALEDFRRQYKQLGEKLPTVVKDELGRDIPVDVNIDPKLVQNNLAGLKAELQSIGDIVSGTIVPAFQNMFGAILAGENPMQAFFKGIQQSVQQLISQLIAAAIQALVLSALTGGGTSFGSAFGKIMGLKVPGMATGGIVPPGFANDSFPARLSSGEAVIPLNKLDQYVGRPSNDSGSGEAFLRGDVIRLAIARAGRKQRRNR